MGEPQSESLFAVGKARWLLQNVDKLSAGERALLLAIVELEKGSGRQVTPEEQQALDQLLDETQAADQALDEIAAAVNQMMTAKTRRRPVDEWPSAIHRMSKHKKS